MNKLRYFIIDAFTDRPFAGNPAAVVPLDHWRDDAWLQNVAMEMNLSETAFLVPNATGHDLRWFTPTIEVDLCGHATLASALALARLGILSDGATVSFSTRSGVLTATRHGSRIALDFPLKPVESALPSSELLKAMNVPFVFVGRNVFDFLVEVDSEATLRRLSPNFQQLALVNCRGVIVTARSADARFDFVSRFFAPAAGIDEDPVTGSAHCALADYWGRKLDKSVLVAYQASARGGIVHVMIQDNRVILSGDGIIVAEGELLVG